MTISSACAVFRTLIVSIFAALAIGTDASLVLKIKDNEMTSSNSTTTTGITTTPIKIEDSQVYKSHMFHFTDVAHATEKHRSGSEHIEESYVLWLLVFFSCLMIFLFLIFCVELLIYKYIRTRRPVDVSETLPPPYHLFAPPTYNETVEEGLRSPVSGTENMADVYVVPVHAAAATDDKM